MVLYVCLISCRETFDVELEPSEDQVVIFSEISPSTAINLDLSITSDILSSNGIQRPEDADIFLSGTDLPAQATSFIYSKVNKRYELRNRDFRPSPGNEYYIQVGLPIDESIPIQAATRIPFPIAISRAKVTDRDHLETKNDLVDIVFDLELELGPSRNERSFIQIIPERVFSEYKLDPNGEIQITFFAETEPLQVLNVLDSPNAINELIHKECVFVDYSKLSGKVIKLRLSTTTHLDPQIDILESIELSILSMTKDLYDYHQSVHRQLINNSTPFTTPVSSFTNIENGLGVFGGYSTSNSLVKLN